MKLTLKKELPIILIVLLPFLYLAYIWNNLPQKVPLHWNFKGEIDRYGDKISLIIIPILLPLFIYVIFLAVPYIDPKKKIKEMGNKYYSIKLFLTGCMSILALYIIYASKNQTFSSPNNATLIIGVMYVVLGNFFKTIKANYFIGIRTPWTLENESVWKKTHRLAGKLWFVGGILVIISSLVFGNKLNMILFIIITAILVLVPIIYSYITFKKISK